MAFNRLTRQIHRWVSLFFALTVVAKIIAIGTGNAIVWLYYLPLPPLALLLLSGLYLFALPYLRPRSTAKV